MRISFIGGGNMATALIGGLIKNGWQAEGIRVAEIDAGARERLARDFGVAAHGDIAKAVSGTACVVLAVKPQQLREVARQLAPLVADKLVVSIAAGIRASDLSRWLGGHRRIVRAMPNTPALVLSGITGLYADAAVPAADRTRAADILAVAGPVLWVGSEEQMDAITAVSGSGPAYVFYFLEALQEAAAKLGFAADTARRLALETFSGALKLARESTDEPALLRARVTSKGGTTERAISVLEEEHVRSAIVRAVQSAAERSREMGEDLGRDRPEGNAT